VKVLLISKAMTVPITHSKAQRLGQHCDLALVLPSAWPGYLAESVQQGQNYRTIVLPVALSGRNHFHFYPGLGGLLRAEQPDLVHIDEEPYSLVTFQATWLAKQVKAKSLAFTWQNIRKQYPPPFSWMERFVYHTSRHIIAGNSEALEVLRNKGYKGPSRVIPQFGVEPDIFNAKLADMARFGVSSDSLSVAYVGRLVPEKGIDLAIRALTQTEGVVLYVVGSGPEKENLATLASGLGLSERVRFVGALASKEIPGFMASVDVLVLPSRSKPNWKEQFGRVLVEAMASGTVVLGSDSGEIPQVIAGAGLVFPEENWQQLGACLNRLKDPELRQALSQAGQERVNLFSQENIVRQTIEVYHEVMA
jgi:glycosyltransferase involved in cell wall biosynthesis